MKEFNTTGICYPEDHYMVNIDSRIEEIEKAVAKGEYITINRGRQYGKTTTLYHLAEKLQENYVVFSISFERMGENSFTSDEKFLNCILQSFLLQIESDTLKTIITNVLHDKRPTVLENAFGELCEQSEKPLVLIIDDIDKYESHDSVGNFLSRLRANFINKHNFPTFHSVIFTCKVDIRSYTLRYEKYSLKTPWNIAVAYTTDMSLPTDGIQQMLQEYESDHHTGMDTAQMAQMITDYTSGYPFFVSRVCQLIDKQNFSWDKDGLQNAVKILLKEKNTFFDDLTKKLEDFPEMKKMLKEILFSGYEPSFNIYYKHISIAAMFNYILDINGKVKISNRIIETWLYNLFATEEEIDSRLYDKGSIDRSQFIDGKTLKMDKILEKFAQHFRDIYGSKDVTFKEEEGRRFFMLYIRPIINGTGNYYIESQTRDRSRTDMIIDYLGTQYIIEMKIWRGESYNERGENQLFDYLDFYHADKGYLLSFCFNKNSKPEARTIAQGGREIVEVVV